MVVVFLDIKLGLLNKLNIVEYYKRHQDKRNTTPSADNAAFHKSKPVREFLIQYELNMIFSVPHCPEYNMMELIFGCLKNKYYTMIFNSRSNYYIKYLFLGNKLKIISIMR